MPPSSARGSTGACVLALRNSAHIGRIGTYGEHGRGVRHGLRRLRQRRRRSADAGAVWLPRAAAGHQPVLRRDPRRGGAPLLLDMATTAIAFGKARVARNKGVPVPEGVLIDAEGRPTTDPTELVADRTGALLSFGLHKGSGLAVLCEMLAAALIGGQRADEPQRGGIVNSMTAVVIDLGHLGDPAAIRAGVDASAAFIKSSATAPGFAEILLPGDPERRAAAKRNAEGHPHRPGKLGRDHRRGAAGGRDRGGDRGSGGVSPCGFGQWRMANGEDRATGPTGPSSPPLPPFAWPFAIRGN